MIQERTRTTKLTRNRFLAFAGTALVAAASQAMFPGHAQAAAPNGCHGYNGCPCCNSNCCESGCTRYNSCGSTSCWRTCAYEGSGLVSFYCCDWKRSNGSFCICRERWGTC
ncbi:MAG TPA: hypothetical protein VGP16_11565 [Asanoa sp.]|nr:hypothetical protein [Asanoa sp.]